ncbi:MAG TPA: PTS sugar transporter subunit IIA, partial [Rhodothermales bacterium]|nr:PTS sugar transporter subunit IIA [Rhodothermales bacterium]
VLAAQTAKTVFLVPEVHVLSISPKGGNLDMLDHIGGTTLFAGPVPLQDWDYRVDHDEVERQGLTPSPDELPDQLFAQLQHERKTLPLALRRGDAYLPFHSGSTLEADDRLIVLHVPETPTRLAYDRFDRLAAQCPVLDIEQALSIEELFSMVADVLAPRLDADPEELVGLFQDREASSSTVLLPGVAIPHIVIAGPKQFEMVMVRSRRGVLFPGQMERVHTVFVLAGSPDERTFHLRALAAIAKIIQWPDFEANWMMALDAEAVRGLVLRSTRRRLPEAPPPGNGIMPMPEAS